MSAADALLLGVAALVPVALLSLTSFLKISVVLSLLRNALGTNDAPSSLVVMGLGLVLSGVAMAPVVRDMAAAASTAAQAPSAAAPSPTTPATTPAPTPATEAEPGAKGAAEPWRALVPADRQREVAAGLAAIEPLRAFLQRHAAPRDVAAFAELARSGGRTVTGGELSVVAPAFITSELWRAFVMAIVLLLPFLVIDLVVGLALTALGATSMSPQAVALPLKLLLFVAVDGWRLLVEALLRSYL